MTPVGQLTVSARFDGHAIRDIAVDLQRPSVTRLFIGQLPDVVIKTIPYLFTLCAQAQRAAAVAAVNRALGEPLREPDHHELWIEVLHENLWRLMLDWPVALGLTPAREDFVAWRALRQSDGGVAGTIALVRGPLKVLAEASLACLEEGAHAHPSPIQIMAPDAWLAYWQGMQDQMPRPPLPTSVAAIYRARLGEVEAALSALEAGSPFPLAAAGDAGWGVGQTLTARGVLTHAIHVVDGKVARYQVQAPTDSFFADAAPLTGLLAHREFPSREHARQALEQAILALDPCLPYNVELHDA